MAMTDRVYLDRGDRISGFFDPPRPCRVLTQWRTGGGMREVAMRYLDYGACRGPRNVAVRYLDNGDRAVIPSWPRLRTMPPAGAAGRD